MCGGIDDGYSDGEPCHHSGCKNHSSHPCEVCGRIAASGVIVVGCGGHSVDPVILAQISGLNADLVFFDECAAVPNDLMMMDTFLVDEGVGYLPLRKKEKEPYSKTQARRWANTWDKRYKRRR